MTLANKKTAASTAHIKLNDPSLLKTDAYIDGGWIKGAKRFNVTNPATGELLAEVADLGADETTQAVEVAHKAWPQWRDMIASDRANLLRRWYDLQLEHKDDLAMLMTCEQGKPLAQAKGEVVYGANYTEWYAEESKRSYGDTMPSNDPDKRIVVIKQSVGVVGAITPWNFPHAMITRKISPALAAGCTVVIKPSEETPLTALALMELANRAGIPAGVINMITTSDAKAVGGVLTSNPLVRKISFTGSTAVGKLLMKQSADTVKKISLELGGNGAFIVFDDANLENAAQDLCTLKFSNAGQVCTNANRVYVQDGVYEAFTKLFKEKVAALKMGNGLQEATQMGPVINQKAIDKIDSLVKDAVQNGAKVIHGGQVSDLGALFYLPTILADVTEKMRIRTEEIFGPVAPLYRFKTEEEVIAAANDTPYGLANYLYSESVTRQWKVGEALESGIISVNTTKYGAVQAPFGGYKESGLGREGGKYGLEEFLETKFMMVQL